MKKRTNRKRRAYRGNTKMGWNVITYIVIALVIVALAVFTKYGLPEIIAGSIVGVKGTAEAVKDVAGAVGGATKDK